RPARAAPLYKELAQLPRLQDRPGRQMRRRIDREEPVIAHEPQLVLGLVFSLEKTFGQEVSLAVGDPDGPCRIHTDGDDHGLSPLPPCGALASLRGDQGAQSTPAGGTAAGPGPRGPHTQTASEGIRGTHRPVESRRPRP